MHSSDRTLLAKLGFSDPDRQNSLHDIACQYLARPETVLAIAQIIEPAISKRFPGVKYSGESKSIFEFHIQKGEGQYATTIGFCDLLLTLGFDPGRRSYVPIEVKISKCTIGDAIRQINIYRSYMNEGVFRHNHEFVEWILATAFDITESDAKALNTNGIHHVRLGAGLQKFAEECRSENNVAKSRIL